MYSRASLLNNIKKSSCNVVKTTRQFKMKAKSKWTIRIIKVCCLILLVVPYVESTCPDSCVCKWKGGKQTVECVNKGLEALPSGMDPETQVLDVSGNMLQNLHRLLFQQLGLVNLQRVYLSRCRIGRLDDLTFQGLTNLVELDLSENMLTSMPVAALAELPALMRLSLARNPLQRIPAASFRSMRYLTTLELSNCELETIEEGAFDGLRNLEWLKLDGNSLRSVGGSTVLPRSLHGITLHGNPWRCDCRLSQLRAWLIQFNIPLTLEPKCSSPDRLAGRLIKSLDIIDFACPPEMTPTSMFLEISYGKNVSLLCKVTGDPEPRIAWWYNGRRIPSLSSLNTNDSIVSLSEEDMHLFYSVDGGLDEKKSELIILNATEKENGTFVCTAENRAGSAQANFSIMVLPLPTLAPLPPSSIEYVVTVGGVVAAIVITLVIIVVAVAVRCCCCHRRHSRRTHDKSSTVPSSASELKAATGPSSSPNSSQQIISQRNIQTNTMLPSSLVVKSNGFSNEGADNMDQSPDLINDTTIIKWKENGLGHGVGNVIDGHYPLYDTVRLHGPHFSMHQQHGLSTISQSVVQEQPYYGSPGHDHMDQVVYQTNGPFPAADGCVGILNPGHYLDSDGFPVDYGLPRPITSNRMVKSASHQVRFADPPSSIRHYENYVLDSSGQLQSPTDQDEFLPDQKYPDTYAHLSPTSASNAAVEDDIRYPSERYPFEYGYNTNYDDHHLHSYNLAPTNYRQKLPHPTQNLLPSPPEGYKNVTGNSASSSSRIPTDETSYPATGTATDLQLVSSTSSDPSAPSSMIGSGAEEVAGVATGVAPPLSPLEVSVGSSSTYAPSSVLHRQPHESPDEGYEDEGVDGTEI